MSAYHLVFHPQLIVSGVVVLTVLYIVHRATLKEKESETVAHIKESVQLAENAIVEKEQVLHVVVMTLFSLPHYLPMVYLK